MRSEGLRPRSFTVDGNPQVIKVSECSAGCGRPALPGPYPEAGPGLVSELPEDDPCPTLEGDLSPGHRHYYQGEAGRVSQPLRNLGGPVR